MKTIIYYTDLIKLIKKVQFKILLIVLHKQVLNYRKNINRSSGLSEAIRYARQGDERNAHMHAYIASCSCEELSHFIGEKQYCDFVVQMKDSLENLRQLFKMTEPLMPFFLGKVIPFNFKYN